MEMKMRPANDWYYSLPYNIGELARRNSIIPKGQMFDSLGRALCNDFNWLWSPEGYPFWNKVFIQINYEKDLNEEIVSCEADIDTKIAHLTKLRFKRNNANDKWPKIPLKGPTVTVNGKEYSEASVALALKAYVN